MGNYRNETAIGKHGHRPLSRRSTWWNLLLLIPLAGLLYPPFYAHINPTLGGVPLFIWYQFAWVLGGVATTVLVTKVRG